MINDLNAAVHVRIQSSISSTRTNSILLVIIKNS